MLDVHFVILGAAIGLAGTAFYLRDTLRGVTQPNRVSWLLWATAPLLAFAVELNQGVGLRSLMTFIVGFSPLLVFIASFHNPSAVWQIEPLDYLCGALSLLGLAAWIVTQHGTVALVASISADGLAGIPTLRKSFRRPDSETGIAYAAAATNAGITLLTVHQVTLAIVGFPIYIMTIASLETLFITTRIGPRLRARKHDSREGGTQMSTTGGRLFNRRPTSL